jgi:hypothetical protein
VGGQLGEVERDQELPGEDQRPGPDERRPAEGEAEREELENRGENRDERET